MIRRTTPWIISCVLLAAVSGIAASAASRMTSGDEETISDSITPGRDAMAVAIVRPVFTEWRDVIETSGIIAPWQEAIINAQIGGYQIVELRADVGDVMKEGQVLAILNQAFLQAQRVELQAKLDRAIADRKRASAFSAKGHLSEKSLLRMETEEKARKPFSTRNFLKSSMQRSVPFGRYHQFWTRRHIAA